MRIAVLALDQVFDSGISVTLDVLAAATSIARAAMGGSPRFDVTVVGVRKKVQSALGFSIPVQAITPRLRPDWLVVPALKATTPETLGPALARADVRDAQKEIVRLHGKGARVAASCIGTFLVAESGLLDHQPATTTWSLAPMFRQRFPHVQLDETRLVVPSKVGATAGAAMSHLDLALWLVHEASPDLAALTARHLVADLRASQAPYIIPSHFAQADPLVLAFERWSRAHLHEGFSLSRAAKAIAASPRSLQRRCDIVLGKSPLSYFQDLRVQHAQSLIHSTRLSIDAIAAEVGYENGATLRTLLRQRLGRGVRELRDER